MNVFVINNSQRDAESYRDLHTYTTYIFYIYTHTYLYLLYTYINAYLYTYKCISLCKKETHVQTATGELNF